LILSSCNNQDDYSSSRASNLNIITKKTIISDDEDRKSPESFLPEGFVIFEKIMGDLNNDGMKDCVLFIKGTDKSMVLNDEYKGRLDKNRRGLIVLFQTKNGYEIAAKNYACFSSENEDGGVYYPPDLDIEIEKGKLYIVYRHGRYGYWKYNFRFQDSHFELIGYDYSSTRGPIINQETSINFLTKTKITKVNTNEDPDQITGDEVFKETKKNIELKNCIKLSEISDFDKLNFYDL
jgi:hypothetical protein